MTEETAPIAARKPRAIMSELPPEDAVILFEWVRLKRAEDAAATARAELEERAAAIVAREGMVSIEGATLSMRKNTRWSYPGELVERNKALLADLANAREDGRAHAETSFSIIKTEPAKSDKNA